jgi:hypothetical protein
MLCVCGNVFSPKRLRQRFCSRACGNLGRVHSEKTRLKIKLACRAKALAQTKRRSKLWICGICGGPAIRGTCRCLACRVAGKSKTLAQGRKPGSGGFRTRGGRTTVTLSHDSTGAVCYLNAWERRVVRKLDSMSIFWVRNLSGFPYSDMDGRARKYYPDFYLPALTLYLEFKGWVDFTSWHKMCSACLPLSVVVSSSRFSQYGCLLSDFEAASTQQQLLSRIRSARIRTGMSGFGDRHVSRYITDLFGKL